MEGYIDDHVPDFYDPLIAVYDKLINGDEEEKIKSLKERIKEAAESQEKIDGEDFIHALFGDIADKIKDAVNTESEEYENFIDYPLQEIADKKLLEYYEGKQESKEYLEHTGLGTASSLHPNAEIRRLCAFDILAKTDDEVYADFEARANQARGRKDQINRAKLDGMAGVGKPAADKNKNKININDLIDEDIVIDEKKTNKRKTKTEIIEKEDIIVQSRQSKK